MAVAPIHHLIPNLIAADLSSFLVTFHLGDGSDLDTLKQCLHRFSKQMKKNVNRSTASPTANKHLFQPYIERHHLSGCLTAI
jgi:hypothetical protein